jgi:predicted nucleic acid-binding protein
MRNPLKRELVMLYIDANIFIYAAINTEELGEKAEDLLQKIQSGEEKAKTSALTFDEVFWAIKKHNLKLAFEVCEALLNFTNLEIIPADRELALSALQLMKVHNLPPRDALHAATAIAEKVDYIISTDAHFDKIKQLKRKNP